MTCVFTQPSRSHWCPSANCFVKNAAGGSVKDQTRRGLSSTATPAATPPSECSELLVLSRWPTHSFITMSLPCLEENKEKLQITLVHAEKNSHKLDKFTIKVQWQTRNHSSVILSFIYMLKQQYRIFLGSLGAAKQLMTQHQHITFWGLNLFFALHVHGLVCLCRLGKWFHSYWNTANFGLHRDIHRWVRAHPGGPLQTWVDDGFSIMSDKILEAQVGKNNETILSCGAHLLFSGFQTFKRL